MRRSCSIHYILLAFMLLGGGVTAPVSAQDLPTGTYRAPGNSLEITSSGRARFVIGVGPVRTFSMVGVGDTLTLADEGGPGVCSDGTGQYRWSLKADTLAFLLVRDPCESRRMLLAMPWTRGGNELTMIGLPLVIITSQRNSENAQHAALPVTVISEEALRLGSVTKPQDLTYLSPGLQVGSLPGGNALLFLRGVGNFAGTSLQDPTVTFNFDGVYIARSTSTGGLFYDNERVEVLKGPQGTLYGRNATGGAVNILPKRPELATLSGFANAEYGEAQTVRADGAVNAPLGQRAAIRLAGQRVHHDAYMKDGTDDQDDWAGRLSLRFDVSKALQLRFVGDYFAQGGTGPGSTPLATGVDHRFGVGSAEGGDYFETRRSTISGRSLVRLPAVGRADNQHGGLNTTIQWQTPAGAFTMVPAVRWSHLDATNTPSGNNLTVVEHSRQTSVESRLSLIPVGRVQTLVGFYYFDEDIGKNGNDFARPHNQFNVSLHHPESGVVSVAPFGRFTWYATDRFRASVGARYTHERKYFRGTFESFSRLCLPLPQASCPNAQPFPIDISTSPLVFAPGSASATPMFNPSDGTTTVGSRITSNVAETFARTTWRSALEYDLTPAALLYTSFETGFKSGGFFFSHDSPVYQPEHLEAFTVGLKSRLAGNRLQANVEAFNWRYRDQQVSKISVDSKGVTNLRTENIGRATIRGAEASLEFQPTAETQLSGNVQRLDATYDSYRFLTPLAQGPPLTGCPVTRKTEGFQVDCSGRGSPYAPDWTVALEAAQGFFPHRSARVEARVRMRYQSSTLAGLDFLPEQQQSGYGIVDASVTLSGKTNRYSVGVFGQNLTDRTVVSNTFISPFSTIVVGALRPPRTIGVRTTMRF